jgi:hypothetical protein
MRVAGSLPFPLTDPASCADGRLFGLARNQHREEESSTKSCWPSVTRTAHDRRTFDLNGYGERRVLS